MASVLGSVIRGRFSKLVESAFLVAIIRVFDDIISRTLVRIRFISVEVFPFCGRLKVFPVVMVEVG